MLPLLLLVGLAGRLAPVGRLQGVVSGGSPGSREIPLQVSDTFLETRRFPFSVALQLQVLPLHVRDVLVQASDLRVQAHVVSLQASDLRVQAHVVSLQASDLRVKASDLRIQASVVSLQASDLRCELRYGTLHPCKSGGVALMLSDASGRCAMSASLTSTGPSGSRKTIRRGNQVPLLLSEPNTKISTRANFS